MKHCSAIKTDLFSADLRKQKIARLDDSLLTFEEHISFAELDRIAPRPERMQGGRPSFPAETMVRILFFKCFNNLSDKKMEYSQQAHCQIPCAGRTHLCWDRADVGKLIRTILGFPYRGYLRPLLYDAAVWRSDFSFEAINMLDMLMLLGANPAIPPDFGWPTKTNTKSRNSLNIAYFPFASIPEKCWNKENFIALVSEMSLRYPSHRHVILGGVGSNESEQQFASLLDHLVNVYLQPALPLPELTEFLRCSALVVSNDTGVRNLAIATATPTVGIFFATVPYRYWPRYDKHEAVFRATAEQPSVIEVSKAMIKILGGPGLD